MLDSIHVKNVRSFKGDHTIPLSPLTILVGENSAGKSTLLALVRLAWDLGAGRAELNFNEAPFNLGSYDDIAYYHGGQGKRATEFEIGGTVVLRETDLARYYRSKKEVPKSLQVSYFSSFVRSLGQPQQVRFCLKTDDFNLTFHFGNENDGPLSVTHIQGAYEGEVFSITQEDMTPGAFRTPAYSVLNFSWFFMDLLPDEAKGVKKRALERYRILANALVNVLNRSGRPYAMSPIRTEPKRTYDALQQQPEPSGSHVPQALSRMMLQGGEAWKAVQDSLEQFGKGSGMFDKLVVRPLGGKQSKESDPFQIQISSTDSKFLPNLLDVGYGVSQVLPVIFDAVRPQQSDTLLIQQPEVHLHPRAQAELGSFLFKQVRPRKRILVETHSDYLIDRIRMDAKDGSGTSKTRYKDVLILFFERVSGTTTVHTIRLSSNGDLLDVPASYRSFFLMEEGRFLGL